MQKFEQGWNVWFNEGGIHDFFLICPPKQYRQQFHVISSCISKHFETTKLNAEMQIPSMARG
jgi:hypothetical protein